MDRSRRPVALTARHPFAVVGAAVTRRYTRRAMSVPIPPASSESRQPATQTSPAAGSRWTRTDPVGARPALAVAATLLALLVAATWGLWFDDTQRHLKPVLSIVMLALGVAAMRWLWMLTRHAREATGSLLRFAQHVARDDVASALDSRRGDSSTPGVSMLDGVTHDAAQALSERERRWKARARLSADWYWETDRDLCFSWVSEDLKSHVKLGLQPADLLGYRHDEVPHYAPPEGGWNELNERMARRRSFREVRIEVRRPGRSSVWIAMSAKARRDDRGRFIGYEGVGRDVTEQHLAFKRLHDSERRYAVIADLSADWYWETDAEHRTAVLGPLAQDLLGDIAIQAIGRRRWELSPDGTTEEAWARHRADLDAHRPFRNFEFVMRGPRGPLWVSVSGRPRFDDKGIFLGHHGVGRDITLRKRAERVLLVRNAQLERLVAARTAELEQSNRDLEAFSRQLAHELRTPIGHVVAFADLLQLRSAERLGEDERGWLAMQAQAARAMQGTVTALLELAHSSAMALERETVNLTALAHELASQLPALERRAPVRWLVEPGLEAHCSEPLVRVVLANLLGNAAKFTREVATPHVVLACTSDDGGTPVFVVEDNGAGFDAQQAQRLFQPFQRLHPHDQRFPGSGIGLSIVRRIVERHGGWVRASGVPGVGARFEFTLQPPLAAGEPGETTDDATLPAA
jgi:PAS domain S-box-containing protein